MSPEATPPECGVSLKLTPPKKHVCIRRPVATGQRLTAPPGLGRYGWVGGKKKSLRMKASSLEVATTVSATSGTRSLAASDKKRDRTVLMYYPARFLIAAARPTSAVASGSVLSPRPSAVATNPCATGVWACTPLRAGRRRLPSGQAALS